MNNRKIVVIWEFILHFPNTNSSKILTLPKISAFEVSLANTKIMQPRHSIKAISQSMVPNDFLLMNLFMTITGNTLAPPSAIVTVTNDSNFK